MQSDIQAVKSRLSIVSVIGRYIKLTRAGSRYVAPCPFHNEKKPSFTVNEDMGTFYCFGCQAKGDVITFYSRINGVDFRQALRDLAKEAGVTLSGVAVDKKALAEERKEREKKLALEEITGYAAKLFQGALQNSPSNSAQLHYLHKRGLSSEIRERFGLGWAHKSWDALVSALKKAGLSPELAIEAGLIGKAESGRLYDRFRGRIIFPISTFPHTVIAFGGRIIEEVDEPKYVNTSETPIYHKGEHLYGLVQAAPKIRTEGCALLTEGYMDVLTLHQFGFENAVGVLGTALTDEQVARLTKGFTSKIILLFDGDGAGRKAALRACQMILPLGVGVRVVLLPEGEDIDSLLRANHGTSIFQDLLDRAPDGLDHLANSLKMLAPREMIANVHSFLNRIAGPELFSLTLSALSEKLGIPEQDLRKTQAELRRREAQLPSRKPEIYRPKPLIQVKPGIVEREILMYACRYPENLPLLLELGAEQLMKAPLSRSLFAKLRQGEEEFSDEEKALVEHWSGPGSPPREPSEELAAVRKALSRENFLAGKELVAGALRRGRMEKDDFETDMMYLRALQQSLAWSGSSQDDGENASDLNGTRMERAHE